MSGLNKHRRNPCPHPLIFTLWYTKISNLRKTGNLETGKNIHVYPLFGYIRNDKHPKNRNSGKTVTTEKLAIQQYSILKSCFKLNLLLQWCYYPVFL